MRKEGKSNQVLIDRVLKGGGRRSPLRQMKKKKGKGRSNPIFIMQIEKKRKGGVARSHVNARHV